MLGAQGDLCIREDKPVIAASAANFRLGQHASGRPVRWVQDPWLCHRVWLHVSVLSLSVHLRDAYMLSLNTCCACKGESSSHMFACKSGASKQLLVFISQLEKPAPQIAGASSVLSSRRSGGPETFLSIA